MASTTITGPFSGQVKNDGSPWPLAMTTRQGTTVLGDMAADLISALIPGYDEVDGSSDEDKVASLVMRWRTCVATASDVQALICADRVAEGRFDPSSVSEDELSALFADKTVPLEDVDEWKLADVPLVLVATDYAPFTDRPPVGGHVLWLDPSDEMAFLRSLAELGLISLYTNDGEGES